MGHCSWPRHSLALLNHSHMIKRNVANYFGGMCGNDGLLEVQALDDLQKFPLKVGVQVYIGLIQDNGASPISAS